MKILPGTFYITTMDAPKNLVIPAAPKSPLIAQGARPRAGASRAEFIIAEHQGFIHDARAESIHVLKEFARRKKRGKSRLPWPPFAALSRSPACTGSGN